MKILGLINKDSGPGFHRVMMPLLMMQGVDIHITNSVTPELIEQYDAIYYNRVVSDEVHKLAKQLNKKIIVDIDDYWHLDPHHISYSNYQRDNFAALQLHHIQHADLITTTHERLQAKIKPYNQRCIVTPNAIPRHDYFVTKRTESTLPRIFWQGSITHEKDIALLKNPFKRLNNCGVIVAGFTKHDVWDRIVSAMTDGLRLPGVIRPGLPPQMYYGNYGDADICVAPLIKSPFNALKSNLKVLEAANVGLPIVCSKVDPYLDLPVLYAEKQTDWFRHLNMLIHDRHARDDYGFAIQGYCQRNFNFEKINQYRYENFKQLLS